MKNSPILIKLTPQEGKLKVRSSDTTITKNHRFVPSDSKRGGGSHIYTWAAQMMYGCLEELHRTVQFISATGLQDLKEKEDKEVSEALSALRASLGAL